MDRIDRPLVAALHQRGAIAKKKEGKKGKKVNKTRQESKQRPSTARSSNNRVAPREEKLLRSSASGARSRAIQGWLSNKTVPRGGGFLCAILKFHASGKYAEGVSLEFNHYRGPCTPLYFPPCEPRRIVGQLVMASSLRGLILLGIFRGELDKLDDPRPLGIHSCSAPEPCWGSRANQESRVFSVLPLPLSFLFPLIPDYSHFPNHQ